MKLPSLDEVRAQGIPLQCARCDAHVAVDDLVAVIVPDAGWAHLRDGRTCHGVFPASIVPAVRAASARMWGLVRAVCSSPAAQLVRGAR